MDIKIKLELSTGKEIELTQEEYDEIKEQFSEYQLTPYISYIPYNPNDSYDSWSYPVDCDMKGTSAGDFFDIYTMTPSGTEVYSTIDLNIPLSEEVTVYVTSEDLPNICAEFGRFTSDLHLN